MKEISYCNGKYFENHEPCIPLTDRGFLFGDGVFTTIKVVDGVPESFKAHVERLISQCESLRIHPPSFLLKDVNELILKNSATKGVWRLKIIVTGGDSPALTLAKRSFGRHVMMINEVKEASKEAVKLTVFPYPICKPTSHFKTLSYLDRLYISDYAATHGFDDALVLSKEGFIMETAFSNIFWMRGLDVFVPDSSLDLLMGVTLMNQIEILKGQGHRIHFVKEKLEDLGSMGGDVKVFICNSIRGVVGVSGFERI